VHGGVVVNENAPDHDLMLPYNVIELPDEGAYHGEQRNGDQQHRQAELN
jgi:hypothetical protein